MNIENGMMMHKPLWLPVATVDGAEIWERTPPRVSWNPDDMGRIYTVKKGCSSRCAKTFDDAVMAAQEIN